MKLIDLVNDAFDLDADDVLDSEIEDTYAHREFAAAIATIITAVLDEKDPGALNTELNDRFDYTGGHQQPHPAPS